MGLIDQFKWFDSSGWKLPGTVMAAVSLRLSCPAASFQLSSSPSPLPFSDCFFLPPSVGHPWTLLISQGSQAVSPILIRCHEKSRFCRPHACKFDLLPWFLKGFYSSFLFKLMPRMQQSYTFTFRVRALILTGSCDRLPTAVRVTHCRPDCISDAQQLTAADSAAEWARFSFHQPK